MVPPTQKADGTTSECLNPLQQQDLKPKSEAEVKLGSVNE